MMKMEHHIKNTHPTYTKTNVMNTKHIFNLDHCSYNITALLNMKPHMKDNNSNVTTVITTSPQHGTSSNGHATPPGFSPPDSLLSGDCPDVGENKKRRERDPNKFHILKTDHLFL